MATSWNLRKVTLLCALSLVILGCIATMPGCSVANAKKAVAQQQRMLGQVNSWHQMVDRLIRQLAAGTITEAEAIETLQGHVDGTPGNVALVQSWQQIQQSVRDGEPLLAVLINVSDLVGKVSERYAVTLADLEARLLEAQDSSDATLAIIAAIATVVTGLPIATWVSVNRSKAAESRGEARGIEAGTFYGAGRVASAIGGLKKAESGVAEVLGNDSNPGVAALRSAINADPTVSQAVAAFKSGDMAPSKPTPKA